MGAQTSDLWNRKQPECRGRWRWDSWPGEMGLDREALPHQSGVSSGFPGGTNSSKVASLSPGSGLLIMPNL